MARVITPFTNRYCSLQAVDSSLFQGLPDNQTDENLRQARLVISIYHRNELANHGGIAFPSIERH